MDLKAAIFAKQLLREAFQISGYIYKIMIPVLILVKILQEIGGVVFIGNLLSPLMQVVGLPGSMGLVWATALLGNLYGGMIVFTSLAAGESMTVAQMTVLCTMMLVAHNIPMEARITQKAGVRLRFMLVLRIGGAFFLGWLLFRIYGWGGWLQDQLVLKWFPPAAEASLPMWILAQIRDLALIFFVVLGLLLIMKILARIGITEIMVRFLNPVLRLLGIGPTATTITIIGMMLGLAYGGGLIIQEAVSGRVHCRDVLFSLALMGLCHSIIEDTLLMAIFGGDFSGILWGRILFSMVMVFLLVKLINGLPENAVNRLFIRPPSA